MKLLITILFVLTFVILYPIGFFLRRNSNTVEWRHPLYVLNSEGFYEAAVILGDIHPNTVEPERALAIVTEKVLPKRPRQHRKEEEGGNGGGLSLDEIMFKMSGQRISSDLLFKEQSINRPITKTSPLSKREDGIRVSLYLQCRFSRELDRLDKDTPDNTDFDISLVTIGSINRLFVLPIFASRWDGQIIFVIHLQESQIPEFETFLAKLDHPILCQSRIRIIAYIVKEGSFFHKHYPINILRNIGIYHVVTSHFIMLDMDMWISEHSYQNLLSLPNEIKSSIRTAVVIPAFFHTGWLIANGTLSEQVESVRERIPFSMNDLMECIKKRKCSFHKKYLFTHAYVPQKWVEDKKKDLPPSFYEYSCWKNDLQEPYLLVARNDSITVFNENFINYGFNKISYVETLRREEYRFVLAGNVFAFDLPHHPSRFQKSHSTNTQSGNYMTNYYFMKNLVKRTKNNVNMLKLCKK